jgi:mono/diheme cytochrome c family protein
MSRIVFLGNSSHAALIRSTLVAPFLLGFASPMQTQSQAPIRPADSGSEIYRVACAQCHGSDGRGGPQAVVALPVAPPDFADCKIATAEPDADWLAVSHDGGPARAFNEMMPAFGRALTDQDILRALDHIRAFCRDRRKWPRGELNLPRPLVMEKAYPEDEVVLTTSMALEDDREVLNEFLYERRLGSAAQLEISVPFGWRERTRDTPAGSVTDWTGGIGDLAIGIKQVVVHSLRSGLILSAGGDVILPTGDEDDELGTGTTIFELFLSGGAIVLQNGFLQAQAGVELPARHTRATDEGFWRAAAGASFTEGRFGRTWSPMVEVLGVRELSTGAPSEWDLLPQMQVTLSKRQHVMASVGVRVPLTQTSSRPTRLLFYVLWDWFDGGILEGW